MTDLTGKNAQTPEIGDAAQAAELEHRLGRLPAPPDPAFAGRLRQQLINAHPAADGGLTQEVSETMPVTSLPSRSDRIRQPRPRHGSLWPRLAWGLAAAVILVTGAFGTQNYLTEQREKSRLAKLEKIPAVIQAPVGAGGKYGEVTVSSWTLATELPTHPKLGMVYRPVLTPYTEAEAKGMAQRLGLPGWQPDSYQFRAYEGAGNEGGVGKLLMIDRTEARVMYQDYYGLLGPKPPKTTGTTKISKDQAIKTARDFLTKGDIPFNDAHVYAEENQDQPGTWQIRFANGLSSNGKDGGTRWPVAGYETWVLVEQASGRVASVNATRAHFLPVDLYPLRSATEAYAEVQKMPFYASQSPTTVTVDRVELAFWHFPTRDLALDKTRSQPVYRFVVHDSTGEVFELKATAVQDDYVKR